MLVSAVRKTISTISLQSSQFHSHLANSCQMFADTSASFQQATTVQLWQSATDLNNHREVFSAAPYTSLLLIPHSDSKRLTHHPVTEYTFFPSNQWLPGSLTSLWAWMCGAYQVISLQLPATTHNHSGEHSSNRWLQGSQSVLTEALTFKRMDAWMEEHLLHFFQLIIAKNQHYILKSLH